MLICRMQIFALFFSSSSHRIRTRSAICEYTQLKLWMLNFVQIIGCRKTKLSMERKMLPLCGLVEYICISLVFRYLRIFRNFIPDISWKFLALSLLQIGRDFHHGLIKKIPYGALEKCSSQNRRLFQPQNRKIRKLFLQCGFHFLEFSSWSAERCQEGGIRGPAARVCGYNGKVFLQKQFKYCPNILKMQVHADVGTLDTKNHVNIRTTTWCILI